MAPYTLSGDYKNTYIYNPYNENFELHLLLNQLCFYYEFSHRAVKPGLNAILFCQARCLKPTVQQTVAISGFTHSHDLLPLTPVVNTRCFLVIKQDTPPSLRHLSMTQVLNVVPHEANHSHLGLYLQAVPYPETLIKDLCSMPVHILNSRSDFNGQLAAYLEYAACWLCKSKVKESGQLPDVCFQK
jgi:hypothetical protein